MNKTFLEADLQPTSVFYVHEISTDKMIWLGNTLECIGIDQNEIDTKKKFLKLLKDEDKHSYEASMSSFVDEISCEYIIEHKSGKQIFVREVAIKTTANDKQCLYGVISCNFDARPAAAKRYVFSSRSILTGKFEPSFLNMLKKTLSEAIADKKEHYLLLISLDNFALIKNLYGEDCSNRIVESLMVDCASNIDGDYKVSRVNEDQFGVVLLNYKKSEVENIANKIGRVINLHKSVEVEDVVFMRFSMGSVKFPLGVKDEADAINKAYLALINAKSKPYEFYSDYEDAQKDHIDSQNEMSQLHYLQSAFNQNRLTFAYQPIISARDGSVDCYECLLRINEGNGRFNSAGIFIPVAEKMGTIESIDEYVLRTVVEQLKENENVRLCMNVSNLTTGSDSWFKLCSGLLANEEQIAKRITIEITETAAQKDLRKAAYFTASMQSLGCMVALDDFGVGYTSFRQLKSLSVDKVKIDGSYIKGLELNKDNIIFIKSLVDFNKSYGLETVAECIETGEIAKQLMDLNVDYFQGYYFGRPDVKKPWSDAA